MQIPKYLFCPSRVPSPGFCPHDMKGDENVRLCCRKVIHAALCRSAGVWEILHIGKRGSTLQQLDCLGQASTPLSG